MEVSLSTTPGNASRAEALTKAGKAAPEEEDTSQHSEKGTLKFGISNQFEKDYAIKVTNSEEIKTLSNRDLKMPVETPPVELVVFQCDHSDYEASCKASLKIHGTKEHKRPVKHERFKCDTCNENLDTNNKFEQSYDN